MNDKEVLIEVRKLISKPENWTKHVAARDLDFEKVPSSSPRACRWCIIGAVYKVVNNDLLARIRITDILGRVLGGHVDAWNDADETTHQDVLDLFDKTIAEMP